MKQVQKTTIGRKLFVSLGIGSAAMAALFVACLGCMLVIDQHAAVDATLDGIGSARLLPVAASVWQMDERVIRAELDSIMHLDSIVGVEFDIRGQNAIRVGTSTGKDLLRREYPVSYSQGGRSVDLGTLKVAARYSPWFDVIRANGMLPFVWLILNVVLVALLALVISSRLITNPLSAIAAFCSSAVGDDSGRPLVLPKRGGRPDELDELVRAINKMRDAEAERKRMDFQLINTQKLESLGLLAGGIAHDFNNLLAAILGNIELAMDAGADRKAVEDSLASARQSALTAATLTRQLLAYAGRGSLSVQSVSLPDVVRDTALLLNVSIPKKCVLALFLADDTPLFDGDIVQIQQVIMNLVLNAADAIGDQPGRIAVRTSRVSKSDIPFTVAREIDPDLFALKYVKLEVSDDGCGMDEPTRARLFEPFFTTKSKGRGLGLSAVHGIVKTHAGVLSVESVPSRGTTFSVYLPASGEATTLPDDVSPISQPDVHRTGTVLVVDDEDAVRIVIARYVNAAGFETIMANGGRQAIAQFEVHYDHIVAVLLDISMPEIGGEEVFRHFRSIRPDIPVIFMSGYDPSSVTQRVRGEPSVTFLQKPFTRQLLLVAMSSLLAKDESRS